MKIIRFAFSLAVCFFYFETSIAQISEGITHSCQKTGQSPFPVESYMELPNPVPAPSNLWEQNQQNLVSWGDTDIRYKKEEPALVDKELNNIKLSAWKGERVSAQFVVSAFEKPLRLSFEVSNLVHSKDKSQKINKSSIFSGFVRYVMTDELNKDGKGGCGYRNPVDFDSTLVADPIDHLTKVLEVPHRTTRAGWVRIWVPQNTKAGNYTGSLKIKDGNKTIKVLKLTVSVVDRELPTPKNWGFHLDLWQNPYAAARYYQTPLWSDAHFKAMEKDIALYANAGGKSITASIMNRPWNGQTHDPFQSMITWKRMMDGSWEFGFGAFDKWVEFMMEMGIDKQINCYSMVPWRLSFEYFDEASNAMKTIETKPGEKAYAEMWGAMLTAFAKHLKQKDWFKKTYISMDERPMEVMQETIKVIKAADKDFKISFAGGKHPEIFEEIDDYCLSLDESFPEEIKKKRKQNGKISSFYTSCSQPFPNSFTFSPPAETAWYGWYAAAQNLDGYLRWAYASWVLEPLLDSRFTTWAAGDTYFVYPGGRTSIRFEKLIQGIQAYEKIQILKKEFSSTNNQKALTKLEETLKLFDQKNLERIPASEAIKKAEFIINSF